MNQKAKNLIEELKLEKHPEGGYYREVYRSEEIISEGLPRRYKSGRCLCTAIYFLLQGKDFSAFHRLKSDEIWHFYAGTALDIYVINENEELDIRSIGNSQDGDISFITVINRGQWFAAEVRDKKSFALAGCTVAPGFGFRDFELGKKDELITKYPAYKELISRLTYR